MQGNPGEGKTTFALRLAAACTTGGTLPGMKPLPPFQVIYQTAEDGLGDTVKPRLIEAAADLLHKCRFIVQRVVAYFLDSFKQKLIYNGCADKVRRAVSIIVLVA